MILCFSIHSKKQFTKYFSNDFFSKIDFYFMCLILVVRFQILKENMWLSECDLFFANSMCMIHHYICALNLFNESFQKGKFCS